MGAHWKALCVPNLLEQISIRGKFHCQAYMVCREENLSEHNNVGMVEPATTSAAFTYSEA